MKSLNSSSGSRRSPCASTQSRSARARSPEFSTPSSANRENASASSVSDQMYE